MTRPQRQPAPPGFGLIIIGSEILDGRRTDRHFETCQRLLTRKRIPLMYALTLQDDPDLITAHLETAFSREEPFFCCGGIGGTPDDHTRGCAARAVGQDLETHPEGEAILRERWGGELTDARLRMVQFPVGADLIPNPINRIPGFRLRQGYFLPGFPDMARAMMIWVLRYGYESGQAHTRYTLQLPDAREGDLGDIMSRLVTKFPDIAFSSLPGASSTGPRLELSVSGHPARAAAGFHFLAEQLDGAKVLYVVSSRPEDS